MDTSPHTLVITNTAGSLGDWLSLTPTLRRLDNPKVLARDSAHTRSFATLYEGLAEVEFTNEVVSPTPEAGFGPFSRRIMNAFGFTGNAIPSVILRSEEIDWAREFLKDYNRPIVFNNTCGGANVEKPITDLCNWRKMPDQFAQEVIDGLNTVGKTPIRFGVKTSVDIYNNYDEFKGLVNIPDLPLRKVAACYKVIGEYAGTDSGDHHLMLAVGGKSQCFVPPDVWHYQHARHLYDDLAWAGDDVRERYFLINK